MIRYDRLLLPFLQAGGIYLSIPVSCSSSAAHYFFSHLLEKFSETAALKKIPADSRAVRMDKNIAHHIYRLVI